MDAATLPDTDELLPPVAQTIWDMKYRFKERDGTPVDLTMDDTRRRVAGFLARNDTEKKMFVDAMRGWKFLPAGRILAGAGTDRRVTNINCYVLGRIDDSLDGIMDALKDAATTMQAGGGIGHDFSTLRPKGAPVHRVGADASGPLSFMNMWDSMCRTIMSAGSRRGAMMGTMRVDHPDIEAFIDAKRDAECLRMFNLSVLVTDDFMDAVKNDRGHDLVFNGTVWRTVAARALWDRIMRATYDSAEPGVIFIDRINAANNLRHCETIHATNPCGEQPLPPWGSCLLGSINLAAFVKAPFEDGAHIVEDELAWTVGTAVRMLDRVVDTSFYPLEQQREEALSKRRLGLGITGLADALAFLGIRYGSELAVEQTRDLVSMVQTAAYRTSAVLAAETKPYPLWDIEHFLETRTAQQLDQRTLDFIANNGLRNSHLTSIAPTGTISLVAGNVSGGIEPVFAHSYTRRVLQPDNTYVEERVESASMALWHRLCGDEPPPDWFVDAGTITPEDHVRMQAAAQAHIDSAVSKTVSVPKDISFEAFKDIYRLAYESGCKGCTTYRPNDITGAVLVADGDRLAEPSIMDRPPVLHGQTRKLSWPGSDHAFYLILNHSVDADGAKRPFEIFINTKDARHHAWITAVTRMISAVWRRQGDVGFVSEELMAIADPNDGQWVKGRGWVSSLIALIGMEIRDWMIELGHIDPDEPPIKAGPASEAGRPAGPVCPKCNQPGMIHQEGCDHCLSCGYSRCA
ncbi:MAG: adenosylcobalamin-dependent ribonucleoside-diphosphate reductase [Alphaproteobacteria bacterium]|nr:adenosylcobalamin-dependent ribonucleoside-diphosphate reductase [Alphaproteobacteria bacterium]